MILVLILTSSTNENINETIHGMNINENINEKILMIY